MSIEQSVTEILNELKNGNGAGEEVTLVAATKTRTAEEINRAIRAGVTDIGENRVQEFCDKFDAVAPCRRHFIGHLQTNKVKYLIGKVTLYDRARKEDENIVYLSMGMSSDYKLCLACGANMVRLGTSVFGERHYDKA